MKGMHNTSILSFFIFQLFLNSTFMRHRRAQLQWALDYRAPSEIPKTGSMSSGKPVPKPNSTVMYGAAFLKKSSLLIPVLSLLSEGIFRLSEHHPAGARLVMRFFLVLLSINEDVRLGSHVIKTVPAAFHPVA